MNNYQEALRDYKNQKHTDKDSFVKSRLKHASEFFKLDMDEDLLKLYEAVSFEDIIFTINCENMHVEEFYELLLPDDFQQSIFEPDCLSGYHVPGVRIPRKTPIMRLSYLDFGKNKVAPPTQKVIDSTSITDSKRRHFGELILPYHDPTVPGAKTDHKVSNRAVADYGHFSADLYEKMRDINNHSRQITRKYLYPVCMYFHMSTAEVVGLFDRCRNIEPLDSSDPTYGLIDKVFVAFLDANCYDYDEFVKVAISQFNKYNKTMPTALFKSPFWQKIRDELLSENGYSK